MIRERRVFAVSNKARNNNAGPIVMQRNKREGGYFVTFINDKKVDMASDAEFHR